MVNTSLSSVYNPPSMNNQWRPIRFNREHATIIFKRITTLQIKENLKHGISHRIVSRAIRNYIGPSINLMCCIFIAGSETLKFSLNWLLLTTRSCKPEIKANKPDASADLHQTSQVNLNRTHSSAQQESITTNHHLPALTTAFWASHSHHLTPSRF